MSAKILIFPCEAIEELKLEGYVLIAWRRDEHEVGWFHGIWKPLPGPGPRWYRSGWKSPRPWSKINHVRTSRKAAMYEWRYPICAPYNWHHLVSEAEAFPEQRSAVAT